MLKGGITVASPFTAIGNTIRDNRIGNNGLDGYAPAIDLGADGSTPNDAADGDSGANLLQNYPALTAVKYAYGVPQPGAQDVNAYLYGDLQGAAGVYKIDAYFYNGTCHSGQRGQAYAYLGSWNAVIGGGSGDAKFNFQVQLPNVGANAAVAFTATDGAGNTSELGGCFPVSKGVLLDDIFKDDFDGF